MGILGTQEKGWGSYSIPKNYLAVKKVTASGSGYLTTSYAEFSPDDAYDNDFKLGLWKSSGKLIGVSDAITITAGGSNETFYELSTVSYLLNSNNFRCPFWIFTHEHTTYRTLGIFRYIKRSDMS